MHCQLSVANFELAILLVLRAIVCTFRSLNTSSCFCMPYFGELCALTTAGLWSFGALAFASATMRASSLSVNVVRLVIALLYLSVLVPVARLEIRVSSSQALFLGISGVIGFAFGDSFLFAAFREVGARISMLIMSSAPAIAAVLAYFFLHEDLSLWAVAGMLVTLGGIGIVVMERNEGTSGPIAWRGIVYGVLAALGQGVGLIFAKRAFMEGDVDGFIATMIRIAASLTVMLPLGIALARDPSVFSWILRDRRALAFTAIGAIFGPFLGVYFSLLAVANTDVGIAATLMATVPIVMLPIVRFVGKEHLTLRAMAGAFIAVAGVGILFLR
jgi:drug/metabolite transporter (DMT)-like permease